MHLTLPSPPPGGTPSFLLAQQAWSLLLLLELAATVFSDSNTFSIHWRVLAEHFLTALRVPIPHLSIPEHHGFQLHPKPHRGPHL